MKTDYDDDTNKLVVKHAWPGARAGGAYGGCVRGARAGETCGDLGTAALHVEEAKLRLVKIQL